MNRKKERKKLNMQKRINLRKKERHKFFKEGKKEKRKIFKYKFEVKKERKE